MASFEKKLTKTDIKAMLVIPTHFMNSLPPVGGGHFVNLKVDASGTHRDFGYYTRTEGNRRPVFKTGWRNYVQEKGLEIGDKIIFTRVDGFPRYKIQALRRTDCRLLGQDIWAEI